MAKRLIALCVALLMMSAALAEAPYCVVEGGVALLADGWGRVLTEKPYQDLFTVRPSSLYAAGKPGEYALLDAQGREVTRLRFEMIHDAGDALIFRQGMRYGAMDGEGRVILQPEWTQLTPDGAGGWLALVDSAVDEIPDALYHIGANGEATATDTLVLGGLRALCEGRMAYAGAEGRFGYADGAGATVIPEIWLSAGDFEDGRAIVTGEGGSGVIDGDGKVLIEPVYPWLIRIDGAFAALDGEGNLALFDEISCRPVYHRGGPLDARGAGSAVSATDGNETLLIGADGRIIATASADTVFSAGADGQFIATEGTLAEETSYLVSAAGERVSGSFQRILPLCSGRYAWMILAGTEYDSDELGGTMKSWDYRSLRWGLMDGEGRQLLPATYRAIRALDEDRLLLVTDGAVMLADRDGRMLRIWFKPEASSGE